jgi:hypothetical protein
MRMIHAIAFAAAAGVAGSGVAMAQETRDYDLAPFEAVDIATGLNAIVSVGGDQSVRVESRRAETLDKLEIWVEGGTLHAQLETDFFDFIMSGGVLGALFDGGPGVTIHINAAELHGVDASSGADVEATGASGNSLSTSASSGADIDLRNVAFGNISASASSGANLSIAGTCEILDADASSGSDLEAGELACETVSANASSGSDIVVNASQSARANASSGGDVSVLGNPAETDFDSSSGGDVTTQ